MANIVDWYVALDSAHGVDEKCSICKKPILKFQDVSKLDSNVHVHADCASKEKLLEVPIKSAAILELDTLKQELASIRGELEQIRNERANR